MLVHQAFRFELDPSDHARSTLASHNGAARFAYNWAPATVIERLAVRREWNAVKDEVAPWWATNSREAYNSGLDALARGLDAWSTSRRERPGAAHDFGTRPDAVSAYRPSCPRRSGCPSSPGQLLSRNSACSPTK